LTGGAIGHYRFSCNHCSPQRERADDQASAEKLPPHALLEAFDSSPANTLPALLCIGHRRRGRRAAQLHLVGLLAHGAEHAAREAGHAVRAGLLDEVILLAEQATAGRVVAARTASAEVKQEAVAVARAAIQTLGIPAIGARRAAANFEAVAAVGEAPEVASLPVLELGARHRDD